MPALGRFQQPTGALQNALINRDGRSLGVTREFHKITRLDAPDWERGAKLDDLVVDVGDLDVFHHLEMVLKLGITICRTILVLVWPGTPESVPP